MVEEESKALSYQHIQDIINNIPDLRLQAIIATQYSLAARAGELIQYQHENGITTQGLLKSNIEERTIIDPITKQKNEILVCTIPNFKNTKQAFKKPFIPKAEPFLYEPFKKWLQVCGEQVFDIKIRRYHYLVTTILPEGYASHALRHSRATHLVEEHNFDAYEIKQFLGHASLDTSSIYVQQDLSRTANKIKQGSEMNE